MIAAARLRDVEPESQGLEVGPELGRGAMSVVYRARRGGRSYALKVIRPSREVADEVVRRRAFREAVVLARLEHPGLVKVVEAGELHGSPFLLMELVEGEELSRLLKRRGPMAPGEVVRMAIILAGALGEVHRHGLVHRDIKPANIIINGEGVPKIIDFGLAAAVMEQGLDRKKEEVVGTFLYTAPEQAGLLKRPVDGRADLYSLGVILFECLAGTPPFVADHLSELLRQHAAVVPPRLDTVRPDVGPALAAIVARLLAKDPDDRYQSAEGVASDLERLSELDGAYGELGDAVLGRDDAREPARHVIPLAGREQELDLLGTLWKEAVGRGCVVAAVEGEMGSGKSRLCREFARRIAEDEPGAVVLEAASSRDNQVPYGVLRAALDPFLEATLEQVERGDQGARSLLDHAIGDIGPILKTFSSAMARAVGQTEDVGQLDSEMFNDALARFLERLAARANGLLLIIDDAAWMDEGSSLVLARIAGAQDPLPILLVVTVERTAETRSQDPEGRPLALFPTARRVSLENLGVDAVAHLVAGHLGGHPLDRRFVERLTIMTNGNPLAVGEYLRMAIDAGLILPAPGQWQVDMEGFASLDLPSNVFDLSIRRLHDLSEETRQVLQHAAVIGRLFGLQTLIKVTGRAPDEVNRSVADAMDANLIARTGPDTYQFVQDRLSETLVDALSEQEAREIHQRVAEVLDEEQAEGSDRVLALARHYALGDWARRPNRAYEVNVAAGRLALAHYAYKDAYSFFSCARDIAELLPDQPSSDTAHLEQWLGEAARGVGRNTDAIRHFRAALEHTQDPVARARLHANTGSVFVDEVELRAAWKECMEALDVLGKPYPRSKLRQVFGALLSWFLAAVLRRLHLGYGSSQGADRERHKLLCRVYKLAGEIRYYAFEPVAMLLLTLRQLLYAHLLGPCLESVATLSWFGVVMGNLKKRSIAEFYGRRAIEEARAIGDPAALHASRMWANFSAHFLGDFKRAEEQWLETLPDIDTWLHPRDFNKAVSDYCINMMMRGYMKEALTVARRGMQKADQARLTASSVMTRAYCAAALSVLGRSREAAHYHYEALELAATLPEAERWARTILLTYLTFGFLERGDLGASLEELIEKWESFAIPASHVPAHPRPMFVFIAYVRLRQYLDAPQEGRVETLERLNRALRLLKQVEKLSYNDCHWYIIQAALARTGGRPRDAARLLEQADKLVDDADSEWGRFEIAVERARLALESGDEEMAQRALGTARSIATRHEWRARLKRLQAEFGAESMDVGGMSTLGSTRTIGSTRTMNSTRSLFAESSGNGITATRYLDALLQVSLAAASSLDPQERARAALDELVKVLGAERGFLFLEGKEGLETACGRNAHGDDITQATDYSSTVVDKVASTQSPLVMVGDEEKALSMAESVVTHGLKSIIAAPLMMDERFIGVVYLDSSLARGLFTEEDLGILTALSNHIAIALETGRLVQVELERKAMEKDLALTSAVQQFFLPREPAAQVGGLNVHGFYRPAAQCSGDWWWYDIELDRILVLVGDVTGHGAASAMLTASMATHYRAARRRAPDLPIEQLLEEMNDELEEVCHGQYNMTMSAVEIDLSARTMRWYNAGGPALLILSGKGKVMSLSCAGTALGNRPFSLGFRERKLEPGDRVFIYTDGLPELTLPNGKQFGIRRLSKQFARTAGKETREAVQQLVEALDKARGEIPLDDDLTFVFVDVTG